jgi:hypothetical protein
MRRYLLMTLALFGICTFLPSCHDAVELSQSQLISDSVVTKPSIPLPEYLKPFTDPSSGSTIVRIADRSAFGSDLPELRHMYAKNQPWNANESYVILNSKYPAALLDGRTYRFVRWVRQPSQSVWSNLNPSLMYGMVADTNQFVKMEINNGDKYTVLHQFNEYDTINFGAGEGNLSTNDRYAALFGLKAGKVDLLVYDLIDNRVVSNKTQPIGTTVGNGSATIDNISMSQSGKYVIVQYQQPGNGKDRGIKLFDRSLKFLRQLSSGGGSHFDSCIDSKGAESIVVQENDSSAIVSVRYSDGKKTTLLPASKLNYDIHVSCRNLRRPGWAYISDFTGNPVVVKANYDRAFAVKLDGSGTIQQFARLNHSLNAAYEHQPHAVPNRNGTKVLFASDWNDRSGPVYTYIAQPKSKLR